MSGIAEKYRPKCWADVLGQDLIVKRLQKIIERPAFDGSAFWLQGASGTGKTSLAWIIARAKCDNDFDIFHLNGDRCNVDEVRAMAATFQLASWGAGGWKALIVDEAHAMSPKAVQALLNFLEPLHPRRIVVFTSTERLDGDLFGNFSNPLASRCKVMTLETSDQNNEIFIYRAMEIAQREGLDGKNKTAYAQLAKKCAGNLRMMLSEVESGAMIE